MRPLPRKASPPKPHATALAQARYRIWQFWRSITPRPLDATDRAIVDETLPADARALFASMSRNDQRHSLTVYRALRERGNDDPDLLAAALLHDCGKGGGRVPLWVRPPLVLLHTFAPKALRRLTRKPPVGERVERWRQPIYNAWNHPEIGADLAADAGLSPRAVLLIRTHHLAGGPAAELHAVDNGL